MLISAGARLSHFEIISLLGEGTLGAVYLAQDQSLDRKVAIKVLHSAWCDDETARKGLIRELRAAAKLEHPNICSIYQCDEEKGLIFIVMEYVVGETLADRLRRKPLELSESLDISEQLSAALAEAHNHAMIHRGMRPQNIMVNDRRQVKIMDFGLAQVGGRMDGMAIIPYISPEQVGGQVIDARSDIFSLGVIVYEMVTSQKPFRGQSLGSIALAILTLDPPPLARYASQVPDELQRIVRKCLAKSVETRYQSARDLSTDLVTLKRDRAREAR